MVRLDHSQAPFLQVVRSQDTSSTPPSSRASGDWLSCLWPVPRHHVPRVTGFLWALGAERMPIVQILGTAAAARARVCRLALPTGCGWCSSAHYALLSPHRPARLFCLWGSPPFFLLTQGAWSFLSSYLSTTYPPSWGFFQSLIGFRVGQRIPAAANAPDWSSSHFSLSLPTGK